MAANEVDATGADRDDASQLSDCTNSLFVDEVEPNCIVDQTNKRSRSELSIPGTTSVSQKIIYFKVALQM